MSVRIILLRHAEADWDSVVGRPAALQELVPLTENGHQQARSCADELSPMRPDRIVSSPMTRALQTAYELGSVAGWPVHVEHNLHEWTADNRFSWSTYEDVDGLVNQMLAHGGEWPEEAPQKWEQLSEVRSRARLCLEKLPNGTNVVVTHSLVIYALTGINVPWAGWVEFTPSGTPIDASGRQG